MLGILGLGVLLFIGFVVIVVVGLNENSETTRSAVAPNMASNTPSPAAPPSPSTGNDPAGAENAPPAGSPETAPPPSGDPKSGETSPPSDLPNTTEGLKLVDDESTEREGVSYIVGHVRNTTDHTLKNVKIRFTLSDESEKTVGEASDSTFELGPGETWSFEARIYADKTDSYELDKLESD